MTERTIFNVQRAITQKVSKPDLQFLISADPLMVLHISVKFTVITETYFNVQRPIVKKVIKPGLWYLCSKCQLKLLYNFARLKEYF